MGLVERLSLAAGYGLAGAVLALAQRPLTDAIWVLTGLVDLGYLAVGLGLCFWFLRSWKRDDWRQRGAVLAIPALLAGLYVIFPTLSAAGDQVWFSMRFQGSKPVYDLVVAEATQNRLASEGRRHGVEYRLDGSRIAFPQPGGLIDNWEAVVFDRSGIVRSARGWRGEAGRFSATPEARGLFGGDLLTCEPVEDDYYRCWFT
jgi:hypothetical protein